MICVSIGVSMSHSLFILGFSLYFLVHKTTFESFNDVCNSGISLDTVRMLC